MPNKCYMCGLTKSKDSSISLVRIPKEATKRQVWLKNLHLTEDDLKDVRDPRICSRHFRDGNTKQFPSLNIGWKFGSPIKVNSERARRIANRSIRVFRHIRDEPGDNKADNQDEHSEDESGVDWPLLIVQGESSYDADCEVSLIEREPRLSPQMIPSSIQGKSPYDADCEVSVFEGEAGLSPQMMSPCVNDVSYLLARIHELEAKSAQLECQLEVCKKKEFFHLDCVSQDDTMVAFYTGFPSYQCLLAFFSSLGPAVHCLQYWGESKQKHGERLYRHKLDPLNQFFLTLIKLRLNLHETDLAIRFGVSQSIVSKYFITWVNFLYHHLSEIDWFPSVDQVYGTLPLVFKEKYSSTYCILDATEIFIETPSDLFLQSSTWSNYKQHNTGKFLVACTPNGAIIFVSNVFAGSISDPELTRESGLLQKLTGKHGVSIMADRGFTIHNELHSLGIGLNIPPFLEHRQQLPPSEVATGRSIASVRIHVERAIGRIKKFEILKRVFPVTMLRQLNQIVHVCAYLTNFQSALVPMPAGVDVEEYFEMLTDSDTD